MSNLAPGERGAINTGTYPNLNIAPPLATEQFTNKTLQDHVNATDAARQAQIAGGADDAAVAGTAAADQARLAQLRDSTAAEAANTADAAATQAQLQQVRARQEQLLREIQGGR